jgi:hypothetical protein
LIDERDGKFLALVEGASLFTNEYLAQRGNAALGLALLGQTDHVVWYVPSLSDSDLEWDPASSLGNLTPDWVTPAILLLLIAGIAAGIWRGRRFGPLVAETLPVTVRASETMHGRAHLTARSGDAEHTAHSEDPEPFAKSHRGAGCRCHSRPLAAFASILERPVTTTPTDKRP